MSKRVQVNRNQFDDEVFHSDIPVVVDFYATSCHQCQILNPILDRLAVEFEWQIKFIKVDADENPSLADQFDVTGLPALVMVDENGRDEGRYLGSYTEKEIRLHLEMWLACHKVAV